MTLGVSDALDLYIGATPTQIDADSVRTTGWGNTALGAKWRFMENDGTSMALKPELRIPVGRSQEIEGLGTGATSYSLTLIASQETSFGAVHLNLSGASDRYSDADPRPVTETLRASVAPVWSVNANWRLALELGWQVAKAAGETTHTHFGQLGAMYALGKDVDIALGALRSTDNAPSPTSMTTYTVGVTWRFP